MDLFGISKIQNLIFVGKAECKHWVYLYIYILFFSVGPENEMVNGDSSRGREVCCFGASIAEIEKNIHTTKYNRYICIKYNFLN